VSGSFVYGRPTTSIEQISSGGTVTYLHHDQQGSTRLLTSSTGTVTGKCTYGAYGTPTKEGSSTNTFNEGDELEKGTGTTYAYDELGERTKTTPEKGGATTYGYDQAGDLTSVERPEKESVPKIEDSYTYNGEGLRTSQTISGTTSYFAWDVTEGPRCCSVMELTAISTALATWRSSRSAGRKRPPISTTTSKAQFAY
jgi:YD repeat-containing protein